MPVTRLFRQAASCLVAPLLATCSVTDGHQSVRYQAPEATRVELTRSLHFPGHSARIHIQFGKTVRWQTVDQWAPHCSFGLNRTRDGKPLARQAGPAMFSILDSRAWVDLSWKANDDSPTARASDQRVAAAGLLQWSPLYRDGTPSRYIYKTALTLYSEHEPQVDDLTCAYRGSRTDRNLTVDEIQDTLGNIALIH